MSEEDVSLLTLKQAVYDCERDIRDAEREFAGRITSLMAQLTEAKTAYGASAAGLDDGRIQIAKPLIYRRGWYDGSGEQKSCVQDFIHWLVTGESCTDPRNEYFGTKNYDRWYSQRSDHPYGMGPRHGSTNFAIGLAREARERDLTDTEREALAYYLENIAGIDAISRKASAA